MVSVLTMVTSTTSQQITTRNIRIMEASAMGQNWES